MEKTVYLIIEHWWHEHDGSFDTTYYRGVFDDLKNVHSYIQHKYQDAKKAENTDEIQWACYREKYDGKYFVEIEAKRFELNKFY